MPTSRSREHLSRSSARCSALKSVGAFKRVSYGNGRSKMGLLKQQIALLLLHIWGILITALYICALVSAQVSTWLIHCMHYQTTFDLPCSTWTITPAGRTISPSPETAQIKSPGGHRNSTHSHSSKAFCPHLLPEYSWGRVFYSHRSRIAGQWEAYRAQPVFI